MLERLPDGRVLGRVRFENRYIRFIRIPSKSDLRLLAIEDDLASKTFSRTKPVDD